MTQPRVSDLLNGKIGKFSLDALVNMLPPVGLTFEVKAIEPVPVQVTRRQVRPKATIRRWPVE